MIKNKHELEYQKALIDAERLNGYLKAFRHIVSVIGILIAIWLIFEGLAKVIVGMSPDGISAFAKVIEALSIGSWLGYLWGAGASVAWYRERNGKHRIIREKSTLQRAAEQDDAYRPTSGLTEIGGTPAQETD